MNKIIVLMAFMIFALQACKKPGSNDTPPKEIYFVLLDKNDNGLIHSLQDNLTVSYAINNGTTQSIRLAIYKIQASPTDTTRISKYGGFVASDFNENNFQGYMTDASSIGVRNFELFLNGTDIGALYLDYWGYLSLSYPPPASAKFTFTGIPVLQGTIIGSYSDGSKIAAETNYPATSIVYEFKQQ